MIRRPPRSTLDRSSAASDVYKRQHGQEQPAVDTIRTERYEFLMVTDSACVPKSEWKFADHVMVRAYAFVDGKQVMADYYDIRENRALAGNVMREILHSIQIIK